MATFMDSGDISLLIPRGGCELLHNSSDERNTIRFSPKFKKDCLLINYGEKGGCFGATHKRHRPSRKTMVSERLLPATFCDAFLSITPQLQSVKLAETKEGSPG